MTDTTTNVPPPTFGPAGLTVPTEPAILAGVLADWRAAFAATGRTLNTELTTPQGQLAQSQAHLLNLFNASLLELIAGVDPATSSGAFQDALGRIYFLQRQPATHATVEAVVRGVAGATLPAGSVARSTLDGSLWSTTVAVTFAANGSASVRFRAQEAGSGPAAAANGLTIYQQRPGWESVSNAGPSTPGVDVEGRAAFEARRAESVVIGGRGTAESVRAAVANVPGVSDVYVYNNGSSDPVTYGTTDYPIPAHSVAVIVAGGEDRAVAEAIFAKLDAGCGMSQAAGEGSLVTARIEDDVNYQPPYPGYDVTFVRPAPVPLEVTVTVQASASLPSTYVQDVQRLVSDALTNGYATPANSITVPRARIGATVVAANYLPPIQARGDIVPLAITIGAQGSAQGASVTLGIDQLPVCQPLNVTVTTV